MIIFAFLVLIVFAVYSGFFMAGFGYRSASHIFDKRDPEAIQRWNLDRRYARLMMGNRKI
jgi:hypothetical protein